MLTHGQGRLFAMYPCCYDNTEEIKLRKRQENTGYEFRKFTEKKRHIAYHI